MGGVTKHVQQVRDDIDDLVAVIQEMALAAQQVHEELDKTVKRIAIQSAKFDAQMVLSLILVYIVYVVLMFIMAVKFGAGWWSVARAVGLSYLGSLIYLGGLRLERFHDLINAAALLMKQKDYPTWMLAWLLVWLIPFTPFMKKRDRQAVFDMLRSLKRRRVILAFAGDDDDDRRATFVKR